MEKKLLWRVVALASGAAAAALVRQGAVMAWRTGRNEEPPNPASPSVRWRDALIWSVSLAIGIGVARVVAERGAAAAWNVATGSPAPVDG
jgi:hypothetical protein